MRQAGIAGSDGTVPRPWHPCQGSIDASTLWYQPMRKETRGIFIGYMAFRHGDHHASLLQDGWQEVPLDEIGVEPGTSTFAPQPFGDH